MSDAPEHTFEVGARVIYTDYEPQTMPAVAAADVPGTVTAIGNHGYVRVKWDDQADDDLYYLPEELDHAV